MATRPATERLDARVDWPKRYFSASMNRMIGLQLKNRMERRYGRVLLGEHDGHCECLRLVRARKHVCAEQTDEPRQREMWMKLSELWGAAAQRCREEQSTLRPGTLQSISTSN